MNQEHAGDFPLLVSHNLGEFLKQVSRMVMYY
jgi:hypothetical protein